MKTKLTSFLILIIACFAVVSCDDKPAISELETAEGYGKNVWHYNENFTAYVTVSIEEGILTQVVIDPTRGYYHTGSWDAWSDSIRDAYISEFVGLTTEEVLSIVAKPAEDPGDHHDGGKVEGVVDAVTSATASSAVIAIAIQDAVNKIVKKE